jgi:G:T-mismatch repair DNA endonuclease (very short patch repair protein)
MCAVCHWLSERDDEWGDRLRRLLANRGIQFKALAKKLADDPDEPDIPWESLSRHP